MFENLQKVLYTLQRNEVVPKKLTGIHFDMSVALAPNE
jgi:hypothetical protein